MEAVLNEVANEPLFLNYNLTDIRKTYNLLGKRTFEQHRRNPTVDEFRDTLMQILNANVGPQGTPVIRRNLRPRPRKVGAGVPAPAAPAPAAAAIPYQAGFLQRLIQGFAPLPALPAGAQRAELIRERLQNLKQQQQQQKKHPIQLPPAEPLAECGCCMGDVVTSKMVACTNGHKVCNQCISRATAAENAIVGKTKINCMSMSSECTGWYSDEILKKILDKHIYDYYQHNKRDAEIMEIKAALADENIQFYKCAHCEAYVESTVQATNATNKIHCVYCLYDTCVRCDHIYQPGHKCAQAAVAAGTAATIHTFEELETNKAVCVCICKRTLLKTEGCNKLTCVCKRIMCWTCKQEITTTGYNHFCNDVKCIRRDGAGRVTLSATKCNRCHTY